jgi:GNAT superfamily N-acetyltransferase
VTTSGVSIEEISASQTHALRRRVLRDGVSDAVVEWEGDDEPTTVHLGAVVDDRIVAISTWLVAPDPIVPLLRSVQLRGMATDPRWIGRGLGRALLDAGLRRARRDGHDRVCANARVTALGFYEAAGLTVSGPVFETASTGLPHRHVHIDLD